MNESELHAANLAYIIDPEIRTAYGQIIDALRNRGFRISVLGSSGPKPARAYLTIAGKESYMFSCNRARKHLSFYLRKEALAEWPQLRTQVMAGFEDVTAARDELKIVLRRPEQIDRILDRIADLPRFVSSEPR